MTESLEGSGSSGTFPAMRSPIGEMTMDGRVLIHRLDPGVVVAAEHAEEVRRVAAALTGGSPFSAVVDMRDIGFADRKAREVFGGEEEGLAAVAFLVESEMSAGLAGMFVRFRDHDYPMEVFTDEKKALDWARRRVAGK